MAGHAPQASSGLPEILAGEAELLAQFVAVLRLEQAALAAGDTTPLPDYATRKASLGDGLQGAAAQRNALLDGLGLDRDRAGVEQWLAARPGDPAAARWQQILDGAREAHELNNLNGKLIQMRLRYNAAALEALQRGSRTLELYGPDGQTRSSGDRRISDSA